MKFFVKEGEVMREATQDEILSTNVVLYNEDGEALGRKTGKVELTAVQRLEGTVGELAEAMKGVGMMAEKMTAVDEKLESYKEAAGRGFPVSKFTPDELKDGMASGEYTRYKMAYQGQSLIDKHRHPGHIIDESRKEIIADYMTLFVEATYFQNQAAKSVLFNNIAAGKYGQFDKSTATDIGDSGNVFPVPDILESEILAFARENSSILANARIWPMSSNTKTIPSESGSITTSWGNTVNESNPEETDVDLTAEILSAYSVVNNETLEDTVSDIVSWITEGMAEAVGQSIDDAGFNGDGTSTYGGCSGILSAACGYSVVLGAGSTGFSDMIGDNLSDMIAKLDGKKKNGGKYYFNGELLHIIRILKDTAGNPIWLQTLGSAIPPTIWGYPYEEVIKITGTSAANTAFGAFGNMRYFAVGKRVADMTLKVDPYGLWTTDKTRFKIRNRWALKIGLANGLVRILTHA